VQGALANDCQVLPTLADVDGNRHHLAARLFGQPADADTGVDATRVGQDNPIAPLSSSFSLGVGWVGPEPLIGLPVRLMIKNCSAMRSPPLGVRLISRIVSSPAMVPRI